MTQHSLPAERIAKIMARSGLCSRREAEVWIQDGRVKINGKIITSPALNVTTQDKIIIDGKPLPQKEPLRLWLYYKPKGLLTTHKDEKDRPILFSHLPKDMPRVISIGRLDMNSEGLILLTNDGHLAHTLESPKTAWKRRYRVRVHGIVDPLLLPKLLKGITIDGIHYGSVEAILERQQGHNAWLNITIREGKNREIRRIMEYFGWSVNRLIRISFGPFQLGQMGAGDIKEIPPKLLKEQLGKIIDQ